MQRLSFGFVAFLLGVVSLLPQAALAWNPSGHQIVALIAYDQLDPATRAKAVELLRAHPRFSEHFESVMPREVKRADDREKDQWIFAHAAAWPDQVRDAKGGVNHQDVTEFNRPWWHFVDLPLYLNDEEKHQLQGEVHVNLRRDPSEDHDDSNMNIIQALKNSEHIVGDATAANKDRAVHLCWVLHLVGDSHQPLHSTALFTTHRFRAGDHGGNFLAIQHGWDLHGFWDEQISTDEPFETLRIEATDLDQNSKLQSAGKQGAATLDPDKWLDESHELAKRHVYTPEVLKKIADREGHSYLGPLDLPQSYKAAANELAERQAVIAGYRLAKTIEKLLK